MSTLYVLGTDTDVGKTVITAGLIYLLRKKGVRAVNFKPVASGGDGDARFVSWLNHTSMDRKYCPVVFEEAVSPHLAARNAGVELTIDGLVDGLHALQSAYDMTIIEGAGGVIVPLNDKGLFQYHLVEEVDGPVVLVCRCSVGTINHTLLSIHFLKSRGIEITGLIFNGFEGRAYEIDNIDVIREASGVPILGVVKRVSEKKEALIHALEMGINDDWIATLANRS